MSASSLVVRAGSTNRYSGGSTHQVAQIIEHSGYGVGSTYNNDVAVFRVSTPFVFSNNVQPVNLASNNLNLAGGTYTKVAGWGALAIRNKIPYSALRTTWIPSADIPTWSHLDQILV
uniref:Peptidase S1 domain-containing protein n=1 Tax=Timema poppense TaxID=170557 RepID=A0A7R9DUH8_TIMPO|nr:unnamed protein product [Timema poppensis]